MKYLILTSIFLFSGFAWADHHNEHLLDGKWGGTVTLRNSKGLHGCRAKLKLAIEEDTLAISDVFVNCGGTLGLRLNDSVFSIDSDGALYMDDPVDPVKAGSLSGTKLTVNGGGPITKILLIFEVDPKTERGFLRIREQHLLYTSHFYPREGQFLTRWK